MFASMPLPTRVRSRRRARGFTLLELIVVITIIGILGTLVVVRVTGFVGKSRATKIEHDLQAIVQAAKYFYLETGSYPDNLEQLLSGQGPNGEKINTQIERAKDPWGNDYIFELRDGEPYAECLGKDGVEGGEDDDEDFSYPKEQGSGV